MQMEIPLEKFFQIFSHGRLAAFDGMANGALVHALLPGDLAVAFAEDQMRLYPDALHLRQRVDSEGIAPDYTGPWDMTLGYLPYYMQGMDMGVLKNEVSDAAAQMGFRCEKRTELLCSGWQDIGILRKIEK